MYVDASSGAVVHRYDNLSKVRGLARVFNPNSVAALGDWRQLLSKGGKPLPPPEAAYRQVTLHHLAPTGRVEGRRITTRLTEGRVRCNVRLFLYESGQTGFAEAMAYYHIDGAVRYLETLGYKGRKAIFLRAIPVDVRGTRDDQSWYSPEEKSLSFGTGGVDDAEDAEVILHELGHAIQDAICPDFGQSPQAAAMGEGFGDYFAASFFAKVKTSRLKPTVMAWDAIASGSGDPPCARRLDEPLTFESFDHDPAADEHENGKIWSATLWDIWKAVGHEVADRIIVESHFQLDGFTTFARGARAILDADRNLFAAKHLGRLYSVFRARGIGPVE